MMRILDISMRKLKIISGISFIGIIIQSLNGTGYSFNLGVIARPTDFYVWE